VAGAVGTSIRDVLSAFAAQGTPQAAGTPAPRAVPSVEPSLQALAPASRTAGLYGLVHRFSNSGAYGAPLLPGCLWATWVAQCSNLTVYGNGTSFNDVGCGPPNGCTFGQEFQCDELAQRYAFYAWGEPRTWYGYGGDNGSAAQMWNAAPALPIPLQRFANGAGVPPQQGDLMIFGPGWLGGYWDGSGHVAIVRDVTAGYVDIVEQNATPSGTDRFPLHGSVVTAAGYTPVTGWLRNTRQNPVSVPIGVGNVAGTPQVVSDAVGDVDVVWRGTDSRLWTVGYRNWRWEGPAVAISPANVQGDPALVSTGPGRLDVYWWGSDAALWHAPYRSGWFGAGGWGAAESLGLGPLQSSPHALNLGGGVADLVWRGAGGNPYLTQLQGGVATPALALSGMALGGDPYPVAVGGGQADVFWRDVGGGLWMVVTQPWGWSPARSLPAAGLSSDPTPVSAGDGNAEVFWRGGDGTLWHLGLLGNSPGAAQQVAAQAMLGRPTAVESGSGAITLVLQRSDGNLATVLALPGIGWVGPMLLGDGPVGSNPAGVSYAAQATSVFWRGQDSGLWSSPACPGCSAIPPPPLAPLH
jgi:CHAP domain